MKDKALGITINKCKNEILYMAGNMEYAQKEALLTACFVFLEEYEKIVLSTKGGSTSQESHPLDSDQLLFGKQNE